MERVYLSREGYEKLMKELEFLTQKKRRAISAAIEEARAMGDLKENAEYHSAKEAMSQNEAKIRGLEDKLSRAEITDDTQISSDKIHIGAKVKLLDLDTDDEVDYTLVGSDEANALEGLISTTSPVGQALLGHSKDDVITIKVPAGDLQYKILQISR